MFCTSYNKLMNSELFLYSLKVKGLSIEHEKLAVAHTNAAENNNSSTEKGANKAEVLEAESGGRVMKQEPTSNPSPGSNYLIPNMYGSTHCIESPQKRTRLISRSPSEMDALGRVSVLRDGTAFRPASAPHPLLLENHLYSSFTHPDNSAHSHTAPHTPTELEREIERERCEEKGHDDQKDSGAEDLRIKQEPMTLTDRERVEKLAERLSGEVFSSNRGFETSNYGMISDQKQNVAPFNHGIISLAHPPTPEHSPAPSTPARWNSKINKAGTVSTPDVSRSRVSMSYHPLVRLDILAPDSSAF
ncbi:hypothetical protein PV326_011784 [Microctonus aethiopoides]|nr:hypothetical protein PV326_011784 [Microctonus aethiopoides]